MRHFLIKIIIICLIWIVVFVVFNFLDFGIKENEFVIIKDNQKIVELIEKNTPIKIEITDDRWGKAVLEEPKILFKIWNMLCDLKPYPNKYVSNQDKINGYIYFFDGSKQYFTISDRFQIGDFLLGAEDEKMNVKELYRILQHTLHTKKNLINMIEKVDSIYLYSSKDFYDPDSVKMINISGIYREKLTSYISQSNKVEDSRKLNELLFSRGYQPIFHIALSFKEDDGEELIILSIISHDFFSVMDMNLLNRNIIYFEGSLFDYCNEMFILNSINVSSLL